MAPKKNDGAIAKLRNRLSVGAVVGAIVSIGILSAAPALAAGETRLIDGFADGVTVQGEVSTTCPDADSYGGTFKLLAYNTDTKANTVKVLIAGEVLTTVSVAGNGGSENINATYSSGSSPSVNAQVTVNDAPVWYGTLTCTVDTKPEPTTEPTTEPTKEPSPEPTVEPTKEPSPEPTTEPTTEPTKEPTPEPTKEPEPTHPPVTVPPSNGGVVPPSAGTKPPATQPLVPVPLTGDVVTAASPMLQTVGFAASGALAVSLLVLTIVGASALKARRQVG